MQTESAPLNRAL
nr:unnamed protein product [Callosobruchus chinensis]